MHSVVKFNKNDIKKRVYFIIRLVQNQNGSTMQGALTSKSDSMGGIFDRYINTISDSLIFEKIILPKIKTNKKVEIIDDFYYYKPGKNQAGIAPDIFGLTINGKNVPFTQFNNKWEPIKNMPQIEIKTFKAKDQMISLRNQSYDDEYLILADLNLRIDYLVPFLDKTFLEKSIINKMIMDDNLFIKKDTNNKVTKIEPIDFDSEEIGTIELIAITNASDFMKQATFCAGNVSIGRMKEIKERSVNIRSNILHDKLSSYANKSPRVNKLFEFNKKWRTKNNIKDNIELLDFSAENIDDIEICKYNAKGIVITPKSSGCSFNGTKLEVGRQYTVNFEVLDRSGNDGSEYFMQKQCAVYLNGLDEKLLSELQVIVDNN